MPRLRSRSLRLWVLVMAEPSTDEGLSPGLFPEAFARKPTCRLGAARIASRPIGRRHTRRGRFPPAASSPAARSLGLWVVVMTFGFGHSAALRAASYAIRSSRASGDTDA